MHTCGCGSTVSRLNSRKTCRTNRFWQSPMPAQNHQTSVISDRVLFAIQIVSALPGALPGSKPEWGKTSP